MEKYFLDSYEWTTDRFENMGWHDCKIHGIAFDDKQYRLFLDIDYILKWVGPDEDKYFSFWIAPATLVFKNVYDLEMYFEDGLETIMEYIERENEKEPRNINYIDENLEWDWNIKTLNGSIKFKSVGYSLYFRREPVYMRNQEFNIDERGGFSFSTKINDINKGR